VDKQDSKWQEVASQHREHDREGAGTALLIRSHEQGGDWIDPGEQLKSRRGAGTGRLGPDRE
jgi:hypothetical protein